MITNSGGNFDFGMVLIGLAILFYGWLHFGFRDLGGFHSPATVYGLLKSWLFSGF